jgi:hypothetical protein
MTPRADRIFLFSQLGVSITLNGFSAAVGVYTITLYGDGSRQALVNSVAYGHQGICLAWIGRLGAAEIREISVYFYSISHCPPTGAAET